MKKSDIILAGVGGQGILSIAAIIGEAALAENLYIKQAEVHGMSQRGGDVQSNLRLADHPISSDLIPLGGADCILSLEPMEALRYLPYLNKEGWIITSSSPFVNIPNYPDTDALKSELRKMKNVISIDVEGLAKEHNLPKCANVILLGAAAKVLELVKYADLEKSVRRIFSSKGEDIVNMNLKALSIGYNTANQK